MSFIAKLRKLLRGQGGAVRKTEDDRYFGAMSPIESEITQFWNNGDWSEVARQEATSFNNEKNRGKLALLVGLACARVGLTDRCQAFIELARTWQYPNNLIIESLIDTAVFLAAFHEEQITGESVGENIIGDPPILSIGSQSKVSLGQAWASNTVNTTIFRHHAILTIDDCQFTAFYANEQSIKIIKRQKGKPLESFELAGTYNLRDAHNSISLGHDRNQCLHITYDHHGTKLRYRKASKPSSIDEWSCELSMTDKFEDKVTYPTFINPRHGHPLTILYRDGVWNNGCARLKTYDEVSESWKDYDTPILSGQDQKPWTCNPYWNHPAIGKDGTIHLSYVWRADSIGSNQRVNNINVCYARSKDNGLTWETSLGQPYLLPITPVNTETVWAVSPGTNLMNQCSMALDSSGDPHIAFYANDAGGIPQYFHLWLKSGQWKIQNVGQRTSPFDINGAGTLNLPISRPEILIDDQDNAHVIFRGDISNNRVAVQSAAPPEYISKSENQMCLWDVDLGSSEPILDRTNWLENQVLTLYLQYSEQQNGDIKTDAKYSDAILLDTTFNFPKTQISSSPK